MKLKISIITPILNLNKELIDLASSISNQLNINSNWIVVGENELKKKFLSRIKNSNKYIFFKASKNEGIYAAINNALKLSKINDYYLVLGQDDLIINKKLLEELVNIVNLDKKIDLNADIYELSTSSKNKKKLSKISKIKQNFSPVFNHHSGGMLIKTNLHKKYGFYDEKYRLASDYKFLKNFKKKFFIKKTDILSAKIGIDGSSAKKTLLGLFERLLIDIEDRNKLLKLYFVIFYFFKIFKQIIFNRKTQ